MVNRKSHPIERADLLGERLLGDVQARGRLREAPFLCDGDEVTQLSQFRNHADRVQIRHRLSL